MTASELSACVILPASGIGERFGADPPKQYTILLDKPLVLHALHIFHRYDLVDSRDRWVTCILGPFDHNFSHIRSMGGW